MKLRESYFIFVLFHLVERERELLTLARNVKIFSSQHIQQQKKGLINISFQDNMFKK